MCEHSLYVDHRLSEKQEKLQLKRIPKYDHMKGLYPQSGDDTRLVCIRRSTVAIIERVKFDEQQAHNYLVPEDFMKEYNGKENVKVTITRRPYYDTVKFPCGTTCNTVTLKAGTKLSIGYPMPRKITGKKGVAVVKAAIAETDKVGVENAETATRRPIATGKVE